MIGAKPRRARGAAACALAALLAAAACQSGPPRRASASLPPPSTPTGAAGAGLERFDAAIAGILQEFQVPGAGFALVYEGRLVMARGYGLADVESGQPVEPSTRFLLASVSKSITTAAVLKLVEEGQLALDARAFSVLGDLAPRAEVADPRTFDITVRDLLYHAGGWNRRTSGDPMTFERRVERALGVGPPMSPRDLARYMLGQPLDFTPGTRCVYSNYGYMLLGMIVERASGRRYTEYVERAVLAPMEITGMVEGAGRERYVPGEARRYGPEGGLDRRGGLPPTHFASGSWIGRPVDLARFMAVIGGSRPPRFLLPSTWKEMLAPPPPPIPLRPSGSHFAMGWDVVEQTSEGVLYHKDGGVVGTTTWIEHDPRGVDWVLFMNASRGKPEGPELHREFLREIHAAIAATTSWPELDLFDRYR